MQKIYINPLLKKTFLDKTMSKPFDCKYPIMLAAMNQVSTIELAIAASRAGIFPSLSSFNYFQPGRFGITDRTEMIIKDLERFNQTAETNNIVLSIELIDVLQDNFEMLISSKLFSHLEILDQNKILSSIKSKDSHLFDKIKDKIDQLKLYNIDPIFKCLHPADWNLKIKEIKDLFGLIILKSQDAAGTVKRENRFSLLEEFKELKETYPDKVFIPTGGISTSDQVKEFVDSGAKIVGVGSYFTTASESIISLETKQKIINSSSNDIKVTNNKNQNALIFSKILSYDMNQTYSLSQGIINSNEGHVFMSRSVDNIKSIKPIKDLVNDLIKNL
jgi:hypothetical protein